MASLQGLPPLPKSFRGLLAADGDLEDVIKYGILKPKDSMSLDTGYHEKTEYVDMNALQISETCECDKDKQGVVVDDNMVKVLENGHSDKPISGMQLRDVLDKLKTEMASLRQQDLSLLYQLWNLNESIQDLKSNILLHDRNSETNSECSSFSLDTGVDSIATIEETEYENHLFNENVYENHARHMSMQEIEEENIYETMYVESRKKSIPPPPPPKRRDKKHEWTGGINMALTLTCYETNC